MSDGKSSRHLVDPDLLAGLDRPRIELSDTTLPTIREEMRGVLTAMADAAPPPSRPVEVTEVNVPGPVEGPDVLVRIFRPAGETGPLPAYLHLHGGGYVIGHMPFFATTARNIAADVGCLVVSVDYRVAPETPAPGPVEDCYAALKWLYAHAAELKVDPARIGIGGESAGGGLAAALGLLVRDRGEVPIIFQCLSYPMLDDRTVVRQDGNPYVGQHGWGPEQNRYGWTSYLAVEPGSADVSAYAAPSRAESLEGLPPTFIVVGALDLFLDECMEFARRLLHEGVPTELHVFAGAYHSFDVWAPAAKISQVSIANRTAAMRRAFSI